MESFKRRLDKLMAEELGMVELGMVELVFTQGLPRVGLMAFCSFAHFLMSFLFLYTGEHTQRGNNTYKILEFTINLWTLCFL